MKVKNSMDLKDMHFSVFSCFFFFNRLHSFNWGTPCEAIQQKSNAFLNPFICLQDFDNIFLNMHTIQASIISIMLYTIKIVSKQQ